MGITDEEGKSIPWRVRAVSTRQFRAETSEVDKWCGHRTQDHAVIPLKPRPNDSQVHQRWCHLLFYLLLQLYPNETAIKFIDHVATENVVRPGQGFGNSARGGFLLEGFRQT